MRGGLLLLLVWGCFAAVADELAIARQALRDGLWQVARDHAAKVPLGDERFEVIVESFARESQWDKVLENLPTESTNELFRYYRALALDGRGEAPAARRLLEETNFTEPALVARAAQLKSRIQLATNGVADTSTANGEIEPSDEDGRLLEAEVALSAGDRTRAEQLWRESLFASNATEVAMATSAIRLGDVGELRRVMNEIQSVALRRRLAVSLGAALVEVAGTNSLAEARKLIETAVLDAPDTMGAKEAYLKLAAKYGAERNFAESLWLYDESLRIWPTLARNHMVRYGRGFALAGQSRAAEARNEFQLAVELSPDDESRASACLQVGDCAAALGHQAEALETYRTILKKYPGTAAARALDSALAVKELRAKGREQFVNYRFEEAERTFAEVARLDPQSSEAMEYRRGQCLYARGLDTEAETVMRQLADGDGNDRLTRRNAMLWMARFLCNRGQREEAKERFLSYSADASDSDQAAEALLWAARCAFAANNFDETVQLIARLNSEYPGCSVLSAAFLLQAEALLELARFDEAVLVLERSVLAGKADPQLRFLARLKKADALFAMGADNPVRYREALEEFRQLRQGDSLDESMKLVLAYKIARTLDKLRLLDEAIDRYYTEVLLAYRNGRLAGVRYTDEARAAFSRAALRLADEYEGRGRSLQAIHVLELLSKSDVPAAAEATKRISRIRRKGRIL